MTFYIVLGISAFLFALLGTRITILAVRGRQPALTQSRHIAPTPRGGGIVVVFTLIICLAQVDFNYGVMFSMLMLAAVSLLGDMVKLSQTTRLFSQAIAVGVPLSAMNLPLLDSIMPLWLARVLVGALWIWFINLFKFMDGIDGLTSAVMIGLGFGLCLLVAIAGQFPEDALFTYGLILSCTAAGFIWWNWHPAKIYLGEVGTTPIGFLSFYLLLLAVDSGYAVSAAILPAYYLCDGTITILRRLYKRKKIWGVHNDYYYQRALRSGRRHDSVVSYVFGINLLLIMLAILSLLNPETGLINLATAYATVFILLGFFAHIPHDPDAEPL